MAGFHILTFGCRSNQADSAAIRASLLGSGMAECDSPAGADVIVVNTCTVTHRSDQQVRQAVRKAHRENPSARIVVTGCYAQRDAASLAALEGVCLVAGNAEKARIAQLLDAGAQSEAPAGRVFRLPLTQISGAGGAQAAPRREIPVPPMAHTGGKTRPLVKLQDGCDNRCAYCIVPSVRGSARSARPEDVLAEMRALIAQGFHEIVLTGINLGAYGRRGVGGMRLPELLRRIVALPGLGRVRLSSIEPIFFDGEVVRLAAESPALAHHFHIPLQSGSDRVLRAMRRPYDTARYGKLLESIHAGLPDAGLGTDVIVGFPGETDLDFEETVRFLEALPLSYLHVFPFSPREGTEAFSLPGRVPPQVAKERMARVLGIGRAKKLAFRRRFAGRTLPAITLAKEEGGCADGGTLVLTHNYIHARVPGRALAPNRLVEVRIGEGGGETGADTPAATLP